MTGRQRSLSLLLSRVTSSFGIKMAAGRRRWWLWSSVAWLLLAAAAIARASAGEAVVSSVDPSDAAPQCVRLAPRILTARQKQLLCSPVSFVAAGTRRGYDGLDEGDVAMPAKCAVLALETRATRPLATKHENDSVLPHVLSLCAGARDMEPASCWLQFPTYQRHHHAATDTQSASPFIQVCRSAQDTAPAKCFQLWLRSSAFLLARDAQEAQPTAIRVCQSMRTHIMSEFAACVKKGARIVGAAAAFPLCEFVVPASDDGSQVAGNARRVIVDCARALARQRLPAVAIAEACARASPSPALSADVDDRQQKTIRPEACMLEAQRSLTQWMDATLFGNLCGQATQGLIAPVECAKMLKHDALRRLSSITSTLSSSSTQRRHQLSEFVARMCRGSVNANAVSACVQLLPPKTLSVTQVERLCSASAITRAKDASRTSEASNVFPAQCVARASPMLAMMARHRHSHSTKDESDRSALLLHLCEEATSAAPSECLASVQFDRRLSSELAVTLCARAGSDAPQKCLRRLERHISSSRLTVEDAATLCSDHDTVGHPNRAAECAERALRELGAHEPNTSKLVTDLCVHATSAVPAECLRQSPSTYALADKVALCRQAKSTDPARCAAQHLKRLTTSAQSRRLQIDLCHGATSQHPTQCALEAPYGMTAMEIVLLCRLAASSIPASCARAIAPSLRLPPEAAARVCSQATSTLPARCLSQEASMLLRRSDPITGSVIRRCRSAHAKLASLEITHVAYDCEQLRVNCPLSLTLRTLDQFNDEMATLSTGYLHVSAEYEASVDAEGALTDGAENASTSARWPLPSSAPTPRHAVLTGRTVVPIVNGSAVFSDLRFSSPGQFALTFRALPDGPEKVARIRIHADIEADSLVRRCHTLFLDQFQCVSTMTNNEQQYLKLPTPLFFRAADCHRHWVATSGGLAPLHPSRPLLFAMPRAVYAFLMYVHACKTLAGDALINPRCGLFQPCGRAARGHEQLGATWRDSRRGPARRAPRVPPAVARVAPGQVARRGAAARLAPPARGRLRARHAGVRRVAAVRSIMKREASR